MRASGNGNRRTQGGSAIKRHLVEAYHHPVCATWCSWENFFWAFCLICACIAGHIQRTAATIHIIGPAAPLEGIDAVIAI